MEYKNEVDKMLTFLDSIATSSSEENYTPYIKKHTDISSINNGFAGELLVQANLITKGFTPFMTNVANSEVDIIALKDGRTYKIQVKTSASNDKGNIQADLRKSNKKNGDYSKESFDILAIVNISTSKVAYFKWSEIFPRTKLSLKTSSHKPSPLHNNCSNNIYFDDFLRFPEIHNESLAV